jgi:RHS repeat-associated protein
VSVLLPWLSFSKLESLHRTQVDSITTDIGYTGQRRDDATGLMHYGARYYDPLLARFTQPDTIVPDPANPQDLNRYSYVRNNPATYTDPTGHALVAGDTTQNARLVETKDGTRYYDIPTTYDDNNDGDGGDGGGDGDGDGGINSDIDIDSDGDDGGDAGAGDEFLRGVGDWWEGLVYAVTHPVETVTAMAECMTLTIIGCSIINDIDLINTCRTEGVAYCAGLRAPDIAIAAVSAGKAISATRGAAVKVPTKPVRPVANATVSDLTGLRPGNALEARKTAAINRLSDQQLLDSVFEPFDGQHIATYRGENTIAQGNHRARALMRRADDPLSSIQWDTPIFIRRH